MATERGYQHNFSGTCAGAMYDDEGRERKARTMVAVLDDFFSRELSSLSLLDIGASTGIVDSFLADFFGRVIGIDIDRPAISFANKKNKKPNLAFTLGDGMNLAFKNNSFDIVICAQIYEHMPNATKLMAEVQRVMRPNGVCYFAAGNRIKVMEPHYNLPLLSVIPRPLAHIYLRLLRRGTFYYENHLSYWGLKRLVAEFEIHDYTSKIIEDPERYHVEYMVSPGSPKQRVARYILRYAYSLCPGYIWLLRKTG